MAQELLKLEREYIWKGEKEYFDNICIHISREMNCICLFGHFFGYVCQ